MSDELVGTIRRNNVLEPMSPYGCYSDTQKPKVDSLRFVVRETWNGPQAWRHVMSTKCRYDKKYEDERCQHNGVICQVHYDDEYVANLKRTG